MECLTPVYKRLHKLWLNKILVKNSYFTEHHNNKLYTHKSINANIHLCIIPKYYNILYTLNYMINNNSMVNCTYTFVRDGHTIIIMLCAGNAVLFYNYSHCFLAQSFF